MQNLIWLIPLGFACGWVINYPADVLPWKRRLVKPFCTHCNTSFSWKDYTLLKACGQCGKKTGNRRWIVIILSIIGSSLL